MGVWNTHMCLNTAWTISPATTAVGGGRLKKVSFPRVREMADQLMLWLDNCKSMNRFNNAW